MTVTIHIRRGTAEQWASQNPVLSDGEPALEKDTHQLKVGDGVTRYVDLPYFDLAGPPGPDGQDGAPGPQGPQGPQGPPGGNLTTAELNVLIDARLVLHGLILGI